MNSAITSILYSTLLPSHAGEAMRPRARAWRGRAYAPQLLVAAYGHENGGGSSSGSERTARAHIAHRTSHRSAAAQRQRRECCHPQGARGDRG